MRSVVRREYREVLLVSSGRAGSAGKVALEPEAIRRELKREEAMTVGQVLRLRVAVLGDLATMRDLRVAVVR